MHVDQPLSWFTYLCTQGYVCVYVGRSYLCFTKDGGGQRHDLYLSDGKHTHRKNLHIIHIWILDTLDPENSHSPHSRGFFTDKLNPVTLLRSISFVLSPPLSTPSLFSRNNTFSHFYESSLSLSVPPAQLHAIFSHKNHQDTQRGDSAPSPEGRCK